MTPATARLVAGYLAAVVVGAAGVVTDAVAAFCLTPTCHTGPATPLLLAVALLVVVAAYAVPVVVVGTRRPVPAATAGVLGAVAPLMVLMWFATTPQSGFCF